MEKWVSVAYIHRWEGNCTHYTTSLLSGLSSTEYLEAVSAARKQTKGLLPPGLESGFGGRAVSIDTFQQDLGRNILGFSIHSLNGVTCRRLSQTTCSQIIRDFKSSNGFENTVLS